MFKTKGEDWYFVILASLVFFLALLVSLWDFLIIKDMNYNFNIVTSIGLILFFVGMVIRLIGKNTMGKYYSHGLRTFSDHKLIKSGIFTHIRHPIYLAAIIYSLGIPLIFSSLLGLIIMIWMIPLILYRIKIEETMLLEKFGDEYRNYMKNSKKLIPHIY